MVRLAIGCILSLALLYLGSIQHLAILLLTLDILFAPSAQLLLLCCVLPLSCYTLPVTPILQLPITILDTPTPAALLDLSTALGECISHNLTSTEACVNNRATWAIV